MGNRRLIYAHHSLIHGPDGGKLSKRHGATSIGEFRDMGYLSAAVVNYLALLSWHPGDEREKFLLPELVDAFDMSRVSKSPAIFDLDKLNWLNGIYMRELPPAELAELVRPYLHEEGLEFADGQREVVAAAIQANLVVLEDAPHFAKVFADDMVLTASVYLEALDEPAVGVVLRTTRERVEALANEYPSLDDARALLKGVAEACAAQGIKGKSIYRPLRVALTGLDQGPELFYLIAGLGRSRILARLADALAYSAENDA